jgi:VCBS repeat-containing protein
MEVLKLSPLAKNMPPRRKRLSRARLIEIPAAIEKFEDRTLLAGNVVVSLAASGLLTVRGDQSANNIAITQTASGLQVASTDSGATEINGSAGPFTASSTVKSISIALKGGDNTLQVGDPSGSPLDLAGNLVISATSGNNTITIANVKIGKGLSITAGSGNNTIVIGGTSTTSRQDPLTDVDLGTVSVDTNLIVSAGSGNDTVSVVNAWVGGKLSIGVGSGNDDVSLMSSDDATISKSLVVSAGSGPDDVLIVGYTVDSNVMIDTRQGADTIGMFSDTFDRAVTVQGGGGSNSYLTNSSDFPNTFSGPSPHLENLQSQPTNVLASDAVFTDSFSWASDLLETTGLLDLAPTAVNQSFTTSANTTLTTGNLLTNDTAPDNGTLSVAKVTASNGSAVPLGTATTLPSGASLTVNANGTFTYNPNGAFKSLTGSQTATDTFDYAVSDGNGGTSASATVTITITAAAATSQAPVAVADSFSTTEGTSLTTGNVLTNDTDSNVGATLSVATVFNSNGTAVPLGTATQLPSGALLTVNSNGTFTYNPNGAFNDVNAGDTASDTFQYTDTDRTGAKSNEATVTISITAAQPVAANESFTTDAQTSLTSGNLLTNVTDSNPGATLSIGTVTNANGVAVTLGTATALPSGALLTVNSNGTFSYDPNGAFNSLSASQTATDTFKYTATDSRGATSPSSGTVTITITGSPDPVAENDNFTTDAQTTLTTDNLLTNDVDPNSGATLTVDTVHDANGNLIPLGTATQLPSGALLTVNSNGTFTYNPNGAFNSLGPSGMATDTFTYTIQDSLGHVSTAAGTVTITVTAPAPTAVNDSFTTNAFTSLTTGNLLTNDTDPDSGVTLLVGTVHNSQGNLVPLGTATLLPSGAQLTVNANGTFIYNPNGAFNSLGANGSTTDTFTYTATDSAGTTSANAGTVTITITSAKPVAVNESFDTDAQTPLTTGNLLASVTDANTGATLSVATVDDAKGNSVSLGTATQLPSGALLTVNSNGTFNYNPNGAFNSLTAGETATDTFSYTVVDSLGNTSVSAGTVTISITPARPVAVNDAFTTAADTPLTTGNLLTNDTDANPGATLSVATVQDANGNNVPLGTATMLPSGALLTVNANGTFTYDPNGEFNSLAAGQTATDTFTYTLSDSVGETSLNSAKVTITITGVASP